MSDTAQADNKREQKIQADDIVDKLEQDDDATTNFEQDDAQSNLRRKRLLLRRFWKTAFGYWGRRGDRLCWMLPGAILLTILLNLAASYGMNVWHRVIFDALERRDSVTVFFLSLVYFPPLATSVTLLVAQVYARMATQRRWRAWLNNYLLDHWLTHCRGARSSDWHLRAFFCIGLTSSSWMKRHRPLIPQARIN